MKRHRSSGSATVADRPMLVRSGARRNSRARPSDSRSPRFEVTSACSSSRMTRLSEPNRYGASAEASSSATCSGVVSKISGGSRRWRWRFEVGVSPVRVSMRIGSRHFGDRRFQIARDVDGERLERRNVERVQSALAAHAAAGGDRALSFPACGRRCVAGGRDGDRWRQRAAQLHQARQKSGKRLAAAGRRDQQHRAAGVAPWPTVPADARAASSRGWRTSARTAPAGRLVRSRTVTPPELAGRRHRRSRAARPRRGCRPARLSRCAPRALARCAGARPAAPSTPRT